jgi:transglutaminase-like putative cysteine protease
MTTPTATRIRLSRRRPVRDTLQLMAAMVRKRRDDRQVRDLALRLTADCARGDTKCRMARVLRYAKGAMRYELDPRGGELIHDPVDTIERVAAHGLASGDCDDGAVLVSSMLESLGVATRLTAVSTRKDRKLHHVAVEAKDPSGFWVYLDPFLRSKLGPPQFSRFLRVAI